MAKLAAKNINYTLNSVAIEDEITSITQNVKQETIKVDGLSDTGPRRVVGNYDFDYSLDGNADFAAAQGDATLFALVGSAGVASGFDPTGNSAAAGDPNYDSTVVLASYSVKGGVGQSVSYSATLEGNSALTRAVA
jgi:hypothetical protein